MNNYHIYEDIAKGKHCVIYKARRKHTIDYYAVKSLEKCSRKKLMNEVKVASGLEHQNVLRFHNWYETKNHLWSIYEYASGGNFLQLLEQDKKLTESQVQVFAKELVQGLLHIHSKGVLYCDLKPSKILLNEYGTLKFCDFGLARRAVDQIQTDQEVIEGPKKGTPSYMAPELFEEDGVFSMQTDLWALGCILYEMIVGQPPFDQSSFQGLVQQIVNKEVDQVQGVSNEFNSLISGLLEKNPMKRLQWNNIILHPFLDFNQVHLKSLLAIQLPPQPHFERWAQLKYPMNNINQRTLKEATKEVNVLRISLNAKKNFKKDLMNQSGAYKAIEDDKNEGDFLLLNRDQTLDIGSYYNSQIQSNNQIENDSQSKSIHNNSSGNTQGNLNSNNSNSLPKIQNVCNVENQQQYLGQKYSTVSNYLNNLEISKGLNYNSTGNQALAGTLLSNKRSSKEDQENILNYVNIKTTSKSPCHASNLESSAQTLKKQNDGQVRVISTKNQPQILHLDSQQQQAQQPTTSQTNLINSYSQQRLTNSSRGKNSQQSQMDSGRQGGAQTPNSPNNLHRTPPNPKYENGNNYFNLQGSSSRTNSSNTSRQQTQIAKNPSTPLSSNTKSISPYHSTAQRNNQKTPTTLGNATNTVNAFPNLNSFVTSLGIQNSQNQQGMPTNSHHQHTHSANSINQQTVSPNRNNPLHVKSGSSASNAILSNTNSNYINNNGNNFYNSQNATQDQKSTFVTSQVQSIVFPNPSLSKKPSLVIESIEKLFYHASDTQVKPIIGQLEAEKGEESSFKYDFPFPALTAEEVEKGINKPEIDSHFGQIYEALLQQNSDKYNILSYFETIIQSQRVANLLIKSSFVSFLLDLLQNSKLSQVRLRSASCIGFLLRFATEIEVGLSSLNIPSIMIVSFTNEKDFKVKRKLMATLGEYLFYAATQLDDNPTTSSWRISPVSVQLLIKVVKSVDEDEIVRFYACKTIENISCQSGIIGQLFCNSDSILSLSHTYFSSKTEELKTSAIASLAHISRSQAQFTDFIIESLGGFSKLIYILKSENATVKQQQSVLSLINNKLYLFIRSSQSVPLSFDITLIEFIVSLLESTHTVIRGKSILSIYLFIRIDIWNLICLSQTKFWALFERLTRDNFKYTQQCFYHLKNSLQETLPYLLKFVSEDLSRVSRGEILLPFAQASYLQQQHLPGKLQFLYSIISIGQSNEIRKGMYEEQWLKQCFNMFDTVHTINSESMIQCRELVMKIFEIILSNEQLVIEKLEFFITIIIPQLLDSLNNSILTNQSTSLKFNSLKLIYDIAAVFAPEWQKWPQQQLQKINDLFANLFIGSSLPSLFTSQEEPIKLLVYRILQALVENQSSFYVATLKSKGMLNPILSQFTQSASRSILRISAKIAQTASLQEITQFNLAQKASQLLGVYFARQQDQCIEDTLDVLIAVCMKACLSKPLQNIDKPCTVDMSIDSVLHLQQQDSLLNAYPTCCSLVSSADASIADKSTSLILYILYLFGKPIRNGINQVLGRSDCVLSILTCVIQAPQQKKNIIVLNWIIQLLGIQREVRDQIALGIGKIVSFQKDQSIASALRDILLLVR